MSKILLPRRAFLTGLVGLVAAPMVAKASMIMPVKGFVDSPYNNVHVGRVMCRYETNYEFNRDLSGVGSYRANGLKKVYRTVHEKCDRVTLQRYIDEALDKNKTKQLRDEYMTELRYSIHDSVFGWSRSKIIQCEEPWTLHGQHHGPEFVEWTKHVLEVG